jgi:5-methylcytosine-specific restriction endonuclease McrA
MKKPKKITKAEIQKKEKRALRKAKKVQWEEVRQLVKDAQNNKCYICNKEVYGMSSHIHHIIDRRFKELFTEPKNLILLCPTCHKFGKLSVHNTAIYFSEILREREPERFAQLIKFLKNKEKENKN